MARERASENRKNGDEGPGTRVEESRRKRRCCRAEWIAAGGEGRSELG